MKDDWETRRYTLEDVRKTNDYYSAIISESGWMEVLIKNANWDIIEKVLTHEKTPLLEKQTITSIQKELSSKDMTEITHGISMMKDVLHDLISYLYNTMIPSDMNINEQDSITQTIESVQLREELRDKLADLDVIVTITPRIRLYFKILMNADLSTISEEMPLGILTSWYRELLGLTLIWLLENPLKSIFPAETFLFQQKSLEIPEWKFNRKEDPEILDTHKKIFTTPEFMRKEGIKQVDLSTGLVYPTKAVEYMETKLRNKKKNPPVFLLVGAEGSGKTTVIRQILSKHNSPSFILTFKPIYNEIDKFWKQMYGKIMEAASNCSNSNPLFVIDELHTLQDFDALWMDLLLPLMKNNNFSGHLLLAHRNSSCFHSQRIDRLRGKNKQFASIFFRDNIVSIQRETDTIANLIDIYLKHKWTKFPFKTTVKHDKALHQLLFDSSDNLNLLKLRDFITSIHWDEYPQFYREKLQEWIQENTLQQLEIIPDEPFPSILDEFNITILFLLAASQVRGSLISLEQIYESISITGQKDFIVSSLAYLEYTKKILRIPNYTQNDVYTYQFGFQTFSDASRIFSVLSTEFEQFKDHLKLSVHLHRPKDILPILGCNVPSAPAEVETFNWNEFGVFQTQPLLKLEPLQETYHLETYFVSPNIQEQIFDLGNLFGNRILVLGDYKVGKTSLKNHLVYQLKKEYDILDITINTTQIKEIKGENIAESVCTNLYRQWYHQLYWKYYRSYYRDDGASIKFHDSEEYLNRLLELYRKIIQENPNCLSIVIFEANQLEDEKDVVPFKLFAEIFQVVWENQFEEELRKRIFILCIGNRSWISYFHIDQTKRFGVFPNWLEFENWDIPKLQTMLEKRVRYALYPAYTHLVPYLLPEKLITKLDYDHKDQISGWLRKYQEILVGFSKEYDIFQRDVCQFEKYLAIHYFSLAEFKKLVAKWKITTLINKLADFRAKYNPIVFNDILKITGLMYENPALRLDQLYEFIDQSNLYVSKNLITELTIQKGTSQLPFKILKHNRISLKWKLREFLDEIKTQMNIDQPQEILSSYVGREKLRKTELDPNLEMLAECESILSNISEQARRKELPDLEDLTNTLLDQQIESIINKLEQFIANPSAEERNILMIDIKQLICQSVASLITIPKILFEESEEHTQELFDAFVLKLGVESADFNWRWIQSIDPTSPVAFSEAIRQFHLFCFHFYQALEKYWNLGTELQPAVKEDIIQTYTPSEDLVSSTSITEKVHPKLGILWAVDGPNVHYLDLIKAEQYIRENLLQEGETLEKSVCLKAVYKNPLYKYHHIYQRYIDAGFTIELKNKYKRSDIDAFFGLSLGEKFLNNPHYRMLILGSVDEHAINRLNQIMRMHPGLEGYLFGDGISSLSSTSFSEAFKEEKVPSILKIFSTKHKKIEAVTSQEQSTTSSPPSEITYQGTLHITPDFQEKFEQGRWFPKYYENGKKVKFYVDPESELPRGLTDVPIYTDVVIQFRITKDSFVEILHWIPIDDDLYWQAESWANKVGKGYMNALDFQEYISNYNFPLEDNLKEWIYTSLNYSFVKKDLLQKILKKCRMDEVKSLRTKEFEDYLTLFPPSLYESCVVYSEEFKKDLLDEINIRLRSKRRHTIQE